LRSCVAAWDDYAMQATNVRRAATENDERRLAKLEAVAIAVERWLADPRYVTEQLMMKALRELRDLDRRA
jgi:hypothetical protein